MSTLVLVPTAPELAALRALGGFGDAELVGFGPVAAAARAAQLCAERRPSRLLLVGIAGSYGPRPAAAEVFGAVRLDGVGFGQGAAHGLPSAMGLAQWRDAAGAIFEELDLAAPTGAPASLLVTVTAAATAADVAARRLRHPGAAGEDMEAFGVALAARMAGVSATVVRGWSNVAGERDHARWDIQGALAAAHDLARAFLGDHP